MASAAALCAVTAICLAPRIVLTQSEAATAAASSQDSLLDEPSTPAVASVAANFSPEAAEAASSDAVLPVTPQPPAIGLGPKLKTGPSSAVNWQPAGVPVPSTPAFPALAPLPAAPAPLTAQPAQLMVPGSIPLGASPAPEPRPGRTPRRARTESADSALEERLERLEKMVETLMARGYATPTPYDLKPSPDTVGPIDRRDIANIDALRKREAEMARKHEMDEREIDKIKEQAKREAARAADHVKRAAVDAEKIARAEQKRQTKRVFREGSQKQLDELRKRLESLEREREKLEHQIEELERNQEQLEDEEQNENQNSDAQSDTSESNSNLPLRQ